MRDPDKRKASQRAAYERNKDRRIAQAKDRNRRRKEDLGGSWLALLSPQALADRYERRRAKRRQAHPERFLDDAHVKAWVAKCKAEAKRLTLCNAHVTAWRAARPGHAWRVKYRTDPSFNTREKIRVRLRDKLRDAVIAKRIASEIKVKRLRPEWVVLLGYDIDALVDHLQSTLPAGRTWQHFLDGSLHIDHIIPRSAFDLSDDKQLRECWSLGNLRLLDAKENMRKGRKVGSHTKSIGSSADQTTRVIRDREPLLDLSTT